MRAIQCLIISIFAILSASGTAPWGGYLGKYLLQRPFIGGLICGIVFGDITPVSYTHLDVYKRQTNSFAGLACRPVSFFTATCLEIMRLPLSDSTFW